MSQGQSLMLASFGQKDKRKLCFKSKHMLEFKLSGFISDFFTKILPNSQHKPLKPDWRHFAHLFTNLVFLRLLMLLFCQLRKVIVWQK